MNSKKLNKIVNDIRNDFEVIAGDSRVLGILLYGSYATSEENVRSDIDVCIVAPAAKKDLRGFLKFVWQNVNTSKYDVKVFEELPLYIKASIIKKHIAVYIKDYGLYEYFYFYRKLWNDQSMHWIEKS